LLDTDRSNPPPDENSSEAPTLELSDAEVDALISGLAPRVRKENERVNGELTLLAERAQVAASASGAAVALLSGDALVCRGRAGTTAPAQGTRIDLASGLSGECARTGGIMLCDDTETDERVDVNSCRALGIRSILVVPLYDKGEVIGIFEVFSPERQAFGHEDIAVLQTMAEMAVIALHPPGAQRAANKESGAVREAKPEIIAATPPRPVPEQDRPDDVSIDLSKLIIEDQPEALAGTAPTLIEFPPAKKSDAEEYVPFHDPDDDLVCELGPERIADLLEQPEIEEPGKPALKLFRTAQDEEAKSPAISKKLLIVAGAVLLVGIIWLKFCSREQTAAPEGQTSDAPVVEPAAPATINVVPPVPSAAPKAKATGVKKRQSAPVKKHASSPSAQPSGALVPAPEQKTGPGEEAGQLVEFRAAKEAEAQNALSRVLTPTSPTVPSAPEVTNGKARENPGPGASRSVSLAQAEGTAVRDVSRPRSRAEELATLQRAATGGDPQAELQLAVHYAYGDGVRQDYFEAVKWFTQAAAQGVTPARGRSADAWRRTTRWLAEHEKQLAQNH
jgi:putative methionine-R-sulfoxide reductase with GAF domain